MKAWPAVEPEPGDWSLVVPDLGYGEHELLLSTRAWNDWGPDDVFVLDAIDVVEPNREGEGRATLLPYNGGRQHPEEEPATCRPSPS